MIKRGDNVREYLKDLRIKQGFTQNDVADKLNILQSYYSMIENGERQQKMTIDLAQKLADVFDVSIEYIFEKERE